MKESKKQKILKDYFASANCYEREVAEEQEKNKCRRVKVNVRLAQPDTQAVIPELPAKAEKSQKQKIQEWEWFDNQIVEDRKAKEKRKAEKRVKRMNKKKKDVDLMSMGKKHKRPTSGADSFEHQNIWLLDQIKDSCDSRRFDFQEFLSDVEHINEFSIYEETIWLLGKGWYNRPLLDYNAFAHYLIKIGMADFRGNSVPDEAIKRAFKRLPLSDAENLHTFNPDNYSNLVLFNDGKVYNPLSEERSHAGIYDSFITKLEVDFVPAVPENQFLGTRFYKFLQELAAFNEDRLNALLYMLALLFSNLRGLKAAKKFFIVVGPSNCGKSVIAEFCKKIFAEGTVSSSHLASLCSEKGLRKIFGKTANICSEDSPKWSESMNPFIKSITAGDSIEFERSNSESTFKPRALLISFMNDFPKIEGKDDAGGAINSRLVLIPVSKNYEDPNPHLLEELLAEKNIVVNYIVQKYVPLIIKGEIAPPKLIEIKEFFTTPSTDVLETWVRASVEEQPGGKLYTCELISAFNSYLKLEGLTNSEWTDKSLAMRFAELLKEFWKVEKFKDQSKEGRGRMCYRDLALKAPEIPSTLDS